MQVKTIKNNIEEKLNEWLESITDELLRREVKKNILVSGGSITSMFLNKEVNDYDVYIKERDVLLKLVEYYANPFELQILKGWEKKSLLSDYEENILKYDSDYKNAFIIAVENLKEDQIKLFIYHNGGFKTNEKATEEEKLKYIPLFFSPNRCR